jgi:lysozyme family protein
VYSNEEDEMEDRFEICIAFTLRQEGGYVDALPPGVDLSVFDMGVNAGIWRSARQLQQALCFSGEEVDGSIGPETLAAVDRFDARTLVANLADRQTAYYRSLAKFPIFGTGWLGRTKARRDAALAKIEGARTLAA